MTAKEFLDLPEDPNKTRYELVHGEVVVSPSPNVSHSYVSLQLSTLIINHIEAFSLGGEVLADIDTYFGPEDVRRPDIFYFTPAREHLIGQKHVEVPPDLCIEILSPSNANFDRVDKFKLYQQASVKHYWIVDPMNRSIEAYTLENGQYVSSGRGMEEDIVSLPPFPKLQISLGKLWWRPKKA
jgi:Uma2 family endonuclease